MEKQFDVIYIIIINRFQSILFINYPLISHIFLKKKVAKPAVGHVYL